MSLRDHLRRWLDDHRDEPLTLTREQAVELGIDQPAPVWLPGYGVDLTEPEEDGEQVTATIHRNRATGEVTLTIEPDASHFDEAMQRVQAVMRSARVPYVWGDVGPAGYDGLEELRERVLARLNGAEDDTAPRDPRPDYCWRCNALPASDPIIGLCGKCHADLKG